MGPIIARWNWLSSKSRGMLSIHTLEKVTSYSLTKVLERHFMLIEDPRKALGVLKSS